MMKNFFIIFFLYRKILTGKINKERLSRKARERYQNLSKEETDKKPQNASERYRNLSEEEKENNVKCPNTKFFLVRIFSQNTGKYGPEKTSYLDTFHTV